MIIFAFAMLALVGVVPLLLYRFVKGPSLADRVAAIETVVAIVVSLLILNAYLLGSAVYIDAALVLSIFGFLSTIAIAKYMERGDLFD